MPAVMVWTNGSLMWFNNPASPLPCSSASATKASMRPLIIPFLVRPLPHPPQGDVKFCRNSPIQSLLSDVVGGHKEKTLNF